MLNPLDRVVHDWVVDHRTAWLTDVAWRVTDLGSTTVTAIGVLVVGIVLAVQRRHWLPLAACAGAHLVTEIVARSTKAIVGRDRPPFDDALEHLSNNAFPSGHVGRAALLAALVALAVPARWRRVAVAAGIVLVVAVAWTRVYLGSHWLTDTLFAWPLGVVAALGARSVWQRGGDVSRTA